MPYLINGELLEFGNRKQILLLSRQRCTLISFIKLFGISEGEFEGIKDRMCDSWVKKFNEGKFQEVFNSWYEEDVLDFLSDELDLTYDATKKLYDKARKAFKENHWFTIPVKIERIQA